MKFDRLQINKYLRSLRQFSQWTKLFGANLDHLGTKPEITHSSLVQKIRKIFPPPKLSPLEKAIRFLEFSCNPVNGYQIRIVDSIHFSEPIPLRPEVFTSAIMYDLVKDLPGISPVIPSILLDFIDKSKMEYGLVSFFPDASYKNEVDTTATCLWALIHGNRISLKEAKTVAKIVTMNHTEKNSGEELRRAIEVYFPSSRDPKNPDKKRGERLVVVDAAVLTNVMRLLYQLEMGWEAKDSEDYIFLWIHAQSFNNLKTKHYPAHTFLYFLSNLVRESEPMRKKFGLILTKRWLESIGKSRNPIALAQRVLTAHNLGLMDGSADREYSVLLGKSQYDKFKEEVQLLRNLQNEENGSWDLDVFYHCSRFCYGSQAVVTAYAANALLYSQDVL